MLMMMKRGYQYKSEATAGLSVLLQDARSTSQSDGVSKSLMQAGRTSFFMLCLTAWLGYPVGSLAAESAKNNAASQSAVPQAKAAVKPVAVPAAQAAAAVKPALAPAGGTATQTEDAVAKKKPLRSSLKKKKAEPASTVGAAVKPSEPVAAKPAAATAVSGNGAVAQPVVGVIRTAEYVGELPESTVLKGVAFRYDFGNGFRKSDAGDVLRYSASRENGSALPSWLVLDAGKGVFTGIPGAGDVGTIRIKVIATDLKGESRYRVFSLEVIESVLGLQAFLEKVMDRNDDIQIQKLEWQSNEKLVNAARGIYEPSLKASFNREDNHLKNTTREALSQNFASEYSELNNMWNASVEGLVPTGAKYRFGYDMKKLQNSVQASYNVNIEYVNFLGVNLTQPLLKGAGPGVANSNIRVARANADIAFEGYRQSMVENIARAVQLYWQCYGAQEKLRMRTRSMEIADEMLKLNKKRYDAGKVDYTAVLDAESGLRLRQALVAAAEQTELTAKRNLLSMFGVYNSSLNPVAIRATDAPECNRVDTDYEKSLVKAYQSFPKYKSALRTVDREKMREAYAKNQNLPQLDLKGSYGLNGLDNSWGSSWDQALQRNYLSWSVGVELNVPLFGNISSRNEAHSARLKKEQAFKRLDMEKVELANQMEIVSGLVNRVYSQVQNYERIVAVNAELLRTEEMRFRMGKSDIRMLLGREEDNLKVRESLLDSRLAYQYALVNLYALEGTLIDNYGLSLAETGKVKKQ
jgi:outer membrane protein TolC